MEEKEKTKILKYQPKIEDDGSIFINVPKQSRLLNVDYQDSTLTFWLCVNNGYEFNGKKYKVIPTGGDVPNVGYEFVKTVFQGNYVWHIWYQNYIPKN